ncbi:MAG TPA: sulfite exporter TauE/SafE family protein [Stenotrophomonas sp.]
MSSLMPLLPFLFVIFLLAGAVKGVVGMGLPTIAMGLLSMRMAPAEAASLLLLPSLLTNLQQAARGGALRALLIRLWPMLVAIGLGTWLSSGIIAGHDARLASVGLGLLLLLYALLGLGEWHLPRPRRYERAWGVMAGALTGLATGATGVFVLPAVPWLVSLRLPRETLLQALGLCFTAGTVALAMGLASQGVLDARAWPASALALLPTLLGVAIGNRLRARLPSQLFRRLFFVTLALLGGHLLWQAV